MIFVRGIATSRKSKTTVICPLDDMSVTRPSVNHLFSDVLHTSQGSPGSTCQGKGVAAPVVAPIGGFARGRKTEARSSWARLLEQFAVPCWKSKSTSTLPSGAMASTSPSSNHLPWLLLHTSTACPGSKCEPRARPDGAGAPPCSLALRLSISATSGAPIFLEQFATPFWKSYWTSTSPSGETASTTPSLNHRFALLLQTSTMLPRAKPESLRAAAGASGANGASCGSGFSATRRRSSWATSDTATSLELVELSNNTSTS